MLDSDKQEFSRLLKTTMQVMRGELPDADVLRLWWAALSGYEFEAVRIAFSQYAQRGKFPPVPADILSILDKMQPDGRPGPDEAWAMVPRDEYTSAVLSEEIAEAMQVAQPLLNEGDAIAARMAFKEAYNRIVERNKMAGIKPKWFPSLGQDQRGREHVLKNAVEKGRLSQEQVMRLLPPSGAETIEGVLLLAAKNKTDDFDRSKALEKIREVKFKLLGAA